MSLKRILPFVFLSISNCYVENTHAAGIAIIEQSISGFKTGYAGATTSIDDASAIVFNPAALSRLKGTQFMGGAHILSPSTKYEDQGSTIYDRRLRPLSKDSGGDAGKTAYIPNFFASHQISDKLYAGFGIFAPFGLGIDYKKTWEGRYHGTKNDMATLNINPSIAYKAHDKLTFGVGLSAEYVEATLESAIDFGGIAASKGLGSASQTADGYVKIKGDDWGFGFNAGVLYEPTEDTRFGFSYRSTICSELSGKAVFKRSPIGDVINQRSGMFKNTGVNASITFPEAVIAGFYHRFSPKWAIMSDVQYTHWRRLKELRVRFKNPVQPDDVSPMKWKGVFRVAGGAHYYLNDSWTFGVGGGFDKSPVPNEHRTIRIPDSDRVFLNAGLSTRIYDTLFFDLSYGHLFFKKAGIDLKHETKGNLKGRIKTNVNILSAGLRYKL